MRGYKIGWILVCIPLPGPLPEGEGVIFSGCSDNRMTMKLITGDIGGTNTRLAVYDLAAGCFIDGSTQVYPSPEYASLSNILEQYCGQFADIGGGCFAVAGPVRNGRSEITNLPWVVDAAQIASIFGWRDVAVLNDLEAIAWGIGSLGENDIHTLNAGNPDPEGNRSVIAAGTGLGEAGLCRAGGRWHPFASEGGHTDFAPADAEQARLLSWLSDKYGHVSWERVASGTGLVDLHAWCCERRQAPLPDWVAGAADPAAALSEAALDGRDEACKDALDIFVRCYGAEAGNLALKQMATGGVYLAGGIAPKLLDRLQQGDFMQAFSDKGRMGKLLESMPDRMVTTGQVSLLGAATYAGDKFSQ